MGSGVPRGASSFYKQVPWLDSESALKLRAVGTNEPLPSVAGVASCFI
jgi:hypothetical protein